MKLIECVPNFSEGRDLSVVAAIQDAIAAIQGVTVLHVTADASHNRSVITFVAPYETIVDAAFAGIREAQARIDLTQHGGVHPRMGAADVVPFIPLDGATMDDCVTLANALGKRVGDELGIPVYLYERAATRVDRRNLANVRRGGFEKIDADLRSGADRASDYGPSHVHSTAGAVAIGARPFLIAYNVYLGGAENLSVAKEVARAVRESNGGLPCVKALGLEVEGQAQVSMNLVDIEQTSLGTVFDTVVKEAKTRNIEVTWSEIIGLIPEQAAFDVAGRHLQLRDALQDHVLERRILDLRTHDQTTQGFLDAVGNSEPTPGGGSVAAYVGALSASLTRMVAGAAVKRNGVQRAENASPDAQSESKTRMIALAEEADQLASQLAVLAQQDAEAYSAVMEAYKLPKETDLELTAREDAIRETLLQAARIPLHVARLCTQISELVVVAIEQGKRSTATDAGVAALMAEAACKAAAYNVIVNVQALNGPGEPLAAEAQELIQTTTRNAALVAEKIRAAYPFPT